MNAYVGQITISTTNSFVWITLLIEIDWSCLLFMTNTWKVFWRQALRDNWYFIDKM